MQLVTCMSLCTKQFVQWVTGKQTAKYHRGEKFGRSAEGPVSVFRLPSHSSKRAK